LQKNIPAIIIFLICSDEGGRYAG